jgi:hypothetical protein
MVNEEEIQPGLVLFLNPAILLSHGAQTSCSEQHRVQREHLFVCLERSGERSLWVPLSSSEGNGSRLRVPRGAKAGHERWVSGDTFLFHGNQTWVCTIAALIEAAATDVSQRWNRNRVVPEFLDTIRDEVRNRGGWLTADPVLAPPALATENSRPAAEPGPSGDDDPPVAYTITFPPSETQFDEGLLLALKANIEWLEFKRRDLLVSRKRELDERKRQLDEERRQVEAEIAAIGGPVTALRQMQSSDHTIRSKVVTALKNAGRSLCIQEIADVNTLHRKY